jgi:hypothetical protein
MLPLENESSAWDATKSKGNIGVRKLFRHYHSPQGPLADYDNSDDCFDVDKNDHHDYLPRLDLKNKIIVVIHPRKLRGCSNGDINSRNSIKHDRALTMYFQQLGKYYSNTAPPSSCSSSVCNRLSRRQENHHHMKMTAKTDSFRPRQAKTLS